MSDETSDVATQTRETGAASVPVEDYVAIQSLLLHFAHPKVRSDFVSGQFYQSEELIIRLEELDELRFAVMPQWSNVDLLMKKKLKNASHHMSQIINRSDDLFCIKRDCSSAYSYKEWGDWLQEIGSSNYWKKIEPDSVCTHFMAARQDPVQGDVKGEHQSRDYAGPTLDRAQLSQSGIWKFKGGNSGGGKFHSTHNRPLFEEESEDDFTEVAPKAKLKKPRRRKIEEIVISNSEDESAASSQESEIGGKTTYRMYKKVVKPQVFEMDGRQHLKTFLETYQHYFSREYGGTSKECTQELRRFLKGELRELYDILGGAELRFTEMKAELISWYKQKKIGGKRHWREEFDKCYHREDEPLKIYGARLRELAQRAYPDDDLECARQLRARFLDTVPPAFRDEVHKMEQYHRIVSGQTGVKVNHLPWRAIMELANEEDLRNVQLKFPARRSSTPDIVERNVWFNSTKKEDNGELHFAAEVQNVSAIPLTSKEFTRTVQRSHKVQTCYWCGKPGHIESKCWKKNGKCLICGGSHGIKDCPRYRDRDANKLKCSQCGKDHLGKDCLTNKHLNVKVLSKGVVVQDSKN